MQVGTFRCRVTYRPAARCAGDGGACLVARNRTNLELAGEVEGESSTLAEHFKRGNAESIPSVYQLVGEEEEGETQGLRRPRISWDGGAGGWGGGGSEDF